MELDPEVRAQGREEAVGGVVQAKAGKEGGRGTVPGGARAKDGVKGIRAEVETARGNEGVRRLKTIRLR